MLRDKSPITGIVATLKPLLTSSHVFAIVLSSHINDSLGKIELHGDIAGTAIALLHFTVDVEPTASSLPQDIARMRVAMLGDFGSYTLFLRGTLRTAGHIAQRYRTVSAFLDVVTDTSFDIVILGPVGYQAAELQLLTRLRTEVKLLVPVVVMTIDATDAYIVRALRLGADECIVMPVGQRELLARLEAVARRSIDVPTKWPSFHAGDIAVYVQSRRIFVYGEPITLTPKEFDLAVFLLHNVGRLLTRKRIRHAIWGRRQQRVALSTLTG